MKLEVGGKGNTAVQEKMRQEHIIAGDDKETGIGTELLRWLFAFFC